MSPAPLFLVPGFAPDEEDGLRRGNTTRFISPAARGRKHSRTSESREGKRRRDKRTKRQQRTTTTAEGSKVPVEKNTPLNTAPQFVSTSLY